MAILSTRENNWMDDCENGTSDIFNETKILADTYAINAFLLYYFYVEIIHDQ